MNILLGGFKVKVGREDIFKPTIGNERLHEVGKGNGVRVVDFVISRSLSGTQCSHIETFINTFGLYCWEDSHSD
jgi:hypothetical protein